MVRPAMSQVDASVDDDKGSLGPDERQPRPVDPMALISYLLSGMVVYGGIGWLLDRWLDFDSLFFPIGVVLGVAAGGYLGYMRFLRS
jgi:F0F1-type ATP synthase assembly protein I